MIKTKRTTISPIKIEDEPDLFEIYSDLRVFEHFGKGVYSKKNHIASIQRAVTKWEKNGIGEFVASNDGKAIARLIASPNSSGDYEIGYALNPEYWRKGFGYEIAQGLVTYAITEKKVGKVVASTREKNIGSEKILKSLGFTKTHEVIKDDGITRNWFTLYPESLKANNCILKSPRL